VRSLKNILFVFSAFAWLGMSMHCQLEAVSGLEFLACAAGNDCHNQPGSDRGEDGCCSVEKSEYKINQSRLTLQVSDLVLFGPTPAPDFGNTLPAEVGTGILTAAPPELPRCWQFSFRTALPARAPSLFS